jgi:hypothetical protein
MQDVNPLAADPHNRN